MQRYIRNEQMLSREENLRLRDFRVAVAGCGGLGGYIIELLARLGIGHITAIDGDVFDISNLNRQLLSHPGNLGLSKSEQARERIAMINQDVVLTPRHVTITKKNAVSILQNHDIVADALDNISTRRIIADAANKLKIPMVHGAIAGWHAQLATIFPGDHTLDIIYPEGVDKGAESELGNPSFTPAMAASLQVAEILKVLLKKEGVLRNKLLVIDTLRHDYQIIELNS